MSAQPHVFSIDYLQYPLGPVLFSEYAIQPQDIQGYVLNAPGPYN